MIENNVGYKDQRVTLEWSRKKLFDMQNFLTEIWRIKRKQPYKESWGKDGVGKENSTYKNPEIGKSLA